jgi:hypothetical protein
MKQVGNILLVEVPEGSKDFLYYDAGTYGKGGKHYSCGIGFANPDPEITWEEMDLPPGDWELLRSCTADKLEESDWEKIVEKDSIKIYNGTNHVLVSGYKDYERFGGSSFFTVKKTSTESGHSLVRSQGYEPSKTVILLKQQVK